MSPVSDSGCPKNERRQRTRDANEVRELLNRGLGRIALVAQSQATHRVEKTFSVLARAIGIDVDVFREIEVAEAWLEDNNQSTGSGEKPLPH